MAGAAAIGIVFGWITVMTVIAAAMRASSNPARFRLALLSLSQLSGPALVSWYFRDWPGVVMAVTGILIGMLLGASTWTAWNHGRRRRPQVT